MNKAIYTVVSAALLFLASNTTHAATVSIDPSSQTVSTGAIVNFNLVISGLGNGSAPSLGTFDLDINFNPAILSFSAVNFGDSVLGDQLDLFGFGSITSYDDSTLGTVNLFQLSFDDPNDLDTLQAADFTMATLTFSALSSGTSALDISINALGDSIGDPLAADITGGSVIVSAVPLPAAIWLLGSGLLGLVGMARHKAA
ncbi:MAG: cohesin domain-containing protein [Sulfuricaulis sp.]